MTMDYNKSKSDVLTLSTYINDVFPQVKTELKRWKQYAVSFSEKSLASQAVSSITHKTFHAQGGSIYSLYPGVESQRIIKFIVAYQTISDYLDNLCDRAGVQEERAFRQLHYAMTDALIPGRKPSDYYLYYPHKNDGGYLNKLVLECQDQLKGLPGLDTISSKITNLAGLYSELQTYKHLPTNIREEKMLGWVNPYLKDYPEISPWEFAAATGSTLGIFVLCAMAHKNLDSTELDRVYKAYFPWIGGLHILLDYFIDLKEDRENGDLNFVSYYPSKEEMRNRLSYFTIKALDEAKSLPHPHFHIRIVRGMLAMYLSDRKSKDMEIRDISKRIVKLGGIKTRLMHQSCKVIRKMDILH